MTIMIYLSLIRHFTDDGFSGVNFNRPSFQELIKEVEAGKLYEHLAEIDTSACNMAEYLIEEMARKQGETEQLKAENMMKWVGLMNNILACADEIVLNDIVYS